MRVADLVAISKTDATDAGIRTLLTSLGGARAVSAEDSESILALALENDLSGSFADSDAPPHRSYRHWTCPDPVPMTRSEIERHLSTRPDGVMRLKGAIPDSSGGCWEVHVVGKTTTVSFQTRPIPASLVAVGMAGASNADDIDTWWHAFGG